MQISEQTQNSTNNQTIKINFIDVRRSRDKVPIHAKLMCAKHRYLCGKDLQSQFTLCLPSCEIGSKTHPVLNKTQHNIRTQLSPSIVNLTNKHDIIGGNGRERFMIEIQFLKIVFKGTA